jgi:hypothetical protein
MLVVMSLSSFPISCVVAGMATIVHALRIIVISLRPTIIVRFARGSVPVSMVISIMIPSFVAGAVRSTIMGDCGRG